MTDEGTPTTRRTPGTALFGPADGEFGRFVDAEPIARGGMGVILRGRDPDLNRVVAIKVVPAESPTGTRDLAKFLREAQVTGQLEHPNIVPVHEISMTSDGRPFFAMKLVRGKPLSETLRESDLPGALQVFLKICDAVAYAHARGVVHRDLKPANVMVGEFGEVLVMDWGLAKVAGGPDGVAVTVGASSGGAGRTAGSDPLLTQEGDVMGTPAYMPPEQAAGEIEKVDARSDVYSLGAILYEILSGAPPFEGGSTAEILIQVSAGELVPPSRRAPDRAIPRELEAVVLRAMVTDPAGRYPSAADLRAEIDAYLAGRLLAAATYTPLQVAAKWVRRHRTAVAAGLAVVLAAAGALGWSRWTEARRRWEVEGEARARIEASRLAVVEATQALEEARASGSDLRHELEESLHVHLRAKAELEGAPEAVRADPDTRRLSIVVTRELGRIALLGADYQHALHYFERLEDLGLAAEDVRRLREEVDAARNAEALREGDRVRAIVATLAAHVEPAVLEDLVIEGSGVRHPGSVAIVAGALDDLVAKAAREGRAARWDAAERDRARFATAVLSRHPEPAVLATLVRWCECVWDARLVVEAGRALRRAAGPGGRAAIEPLLAIRDRLGPDSTAWQRLYRSLDGIVAGEDCPAGTVGRLLLEAGRFDEARAAFASVLSGRPDDGPSLLGLAATEEARGDVRLAYHSALAALDPLRAADRPDLLATALIEVGRLRALLADRGEDPDRVEAYERALASMAEALAVRPEHVGALLRLGRLKTAWGAWDPEPFADGETHWDQAAEYYGRAIREDPSSSLAHRLRGELLGLAGRPVDALADLERAMQLDPDAPETYYERGRLRAAAGERQLAREDFERAIALGPGDLRAWEERGVLEVESGESEHAVETLTRAIEGGYATARAHTARARAHAALDRPELASADLRQALSIDPRHAPAFALRGSLRARAGEVESALEDLTRAIEIDPACYSAWTDRGTVELERGGFAAAARDFGRAAEIRPSAAEAHAWLGRARLRGGDPAGALDALDRAIEIDPARREALVDRGDARAALARPENALEDYSRAFDLDRNWTAPLLHRVTLHTELGRFADAEMDLFTAVSIDPKDWQIFRLWGLLEERRGRKPAARTHLRAALGLAPPEARPEIEERLRRLDD